MLALNAHIRRDNPIRAVEQTEGVLRVPGLMPAASGKPDHERVNTVLQDSMAPMLADLAQRYDPTVDDLPPLFGTVIDPNSLYSIIAAWREESWRNAEQLRHARALGGVDGPLYRAKLVQIEASAKAGAAHPRGDADDAPQQREAQPVLRPPGICIRAYERRDHRRAHRAAGGRGARAAHARAGGQRQRRGARLRPRAACRRSRSSSTAAGISCDSGERCAARAPTPTTRTCATPRRSSAISSRSAPAAGIEFRRDRLTWIA